nr:MerR family transcriptional regulator [Pseudoprevotella muciniphila]
MMANEKDLKLYYSINEVAEMFGIKDTTLRFWEREFPKQINPKKTSRNVRQYTKDDIEQIRVIHNLVKVRGLKISAARELLKKNKSGVQQEAELVARLQKIRAELIAIKKNLEELE